MNAPPETALCEPGKEPAAPGPGKSRRDRVHEITGTFVLVITAALIAVMVWTGRSQRWFKSRVHLRIALPEAGAAGIRQGSELYFLGTLVGTVSDVTVDPSGRMEARVNMRRDFFRFVRSDSFAVVKRKFGVAGDSFFEITRGEGTPLNEQEALIVCKEQFQSAVEAAVEEVRREVLLVLTNASGGLTAWRNLGTELAESRRRLDRLITRLEDLATAAGTGRGTFGQLMTDPALVDESRGLLAEARVGIVELRGVITNLAGASRNLQDGTARLPGIMAAVADEAVDLPGLIQQSQTSMRELQRLIDAMQHHWFLRKYVNLTNPPPVQPAIGGPRSVPVPPARERHAYR